MPKTKTRELSTEWDALGFPYQATNAGNILWAARAGYNPKANKALVVEVWHKEKSFYFMGYYGDDEIRDKAEEVRRKRGVVSITILSSEVIK